MKGGRHGGHESVWFLARFLPGYPKRCRLPEGWSFTLVCSREALFTFVPRAELQRGGDICHPNLKHTTPKKHLSLSSPVTELIIYFSLYLGLLGIHLLVMEQKSRWEFELRYLHWGTTISVDGWRNIFVGYEIKASLWVSLRTLSLPWKSFYLVVTY